MEILTLDADGPAIATERDATDVIGEAFGTQATLVVIPVSRLTPDFFQLSTRLAGEIAQKFVNYRIRLAIIGDISAYVAGSSALSEFVTESNRGSQLWFYPTLEDLHSRLKGLLSK